MNNKANKKAPKTLIIRNSRFGNPNAPAGGDDTSRADASGTSRGQMSHDPQRSAGTPQETERHAPSNTQRRGALSTDGKTFEELQRIHLPQALKRRQEEERDRQLSSRHMPTRDPKLALLPIHAKKGELMQAVLDNQIVIVQGETGCGKSTQVPAFMAELLVKQRQEGMVFCTQPRQQAASSLCKRVRSELRCRTEDLFVGYHHGGAKELSNETVLLYLTEGVLLQYLYSDWMIGRCAVLVLDEVHEMSVDMAIILAFFKTFVLPERPELRLVVMSATLSVPALQKYFNVGQEETFVLEGRCFKVTRRYVHAARDAYVAAALHLVEKLVTSDGPDDHGDILVFLPGQEDVDQLVGQIRRHDEIKHRVVSLAAYASLPYEELAMMEMPIRTLIAELRLNHTPERKVIAATNIAETSLTIDGVRHVIDSFYQKIDRYSYRTGATELVKVRCTKAQSAQRAGRAGRTQEGHYYALCTEDDYEQAAEAAVPAIQRGEPMAWFLRLKMLGVDPFQLDFLDKPPSEHMSDALAQLYLIGALNKRYAVSDMGKKIAHFSLQPKMARALIESARLGGIVDVLGLACLLGDEQRVFMPTKKRQYHDEETTFDEEAQERARKELDDEMAKKLSFYDLQGQGDHFKYIRVWRCWRCLPKDRRRWMCMQHCVNYKYMTLADHTYEKLYPEVKKLLGPNSAPLRQPRMDDPINYDAIRKALVAGFATNIARFDSPTTGYKLLLQTPAHAPMIELDSRSVLSANCEFYSVVVSSEGKAGVGGQQPAMPTKLRAPDTFPPYVLFHRLAESHKPNANTMRTCTRIELEEMDVKKITDGRLELSTDGECQYITPV